MNDGWETSAQAWIDSTGERGDWDASTCSIPWWMIASNALDVGCGEGRFCRRLKAFGVAVEEACECV